MLGSFYFEGRGMEEEDYTEGTKWWKLASEQGHTQAQISLGMMHAEGEGVDQDYLESARLFKLAADQGDEYGKAGLTKVLHECLFPPTTKVELVGLPAAFLNGLHGVVMAQPGGGAPVAPDAVGKVTVQLENKRTQAIPYVNLKRV
jgi:hypothetical protein